MRLFAHSFVSLPREAEEGDIVCLQDVQVCRDILWLIYQPARFEGKVAVIGKNGEWAAAIFKSEPGEPPSIKWESPGFQIFGDDMERITKCVNIFNEVIY